MATQELVASEAWYHKSCYKDKTRPICEKESSHSEEANNEVLAYQRLFDYIRKGVLEKSKIVKFTEITQTLVRFMDEIGMETCGSAKKNLKRKLMHEFEDNLVFVYYHASAI